MPKERPEDQPCYWKYRAAEAHQELVEPKSAPVAGHLVATRKPMLLHDMPWKLRPLTLPPARRIGFPANLQELANKMKFDADIRSATSNVLYSLQKYVSMTMTATKPLENSLETSYDKKFSNDKCFVLDNMEESVRKYRTASSGSTEQLRVSHDSSPSEIFSYRKHSVSDDFEEGSHQSVLVTPKSTESVGNSLEKPLNNNCRKLKIDYQNFLSNLAKEEHLEKSQKTTVCTTLGDGEFTVTVNIQKNHLKAIPANPKSHKQSRIVETVCTRPGISNLSVPDPKKEAKNVPLNDRFHNATNSVFKVIPESSKRDSVRLNPEKISYKDISDNSGLQTQNSAIFNSQKSACDNNPAISNYNKRGPKLETVDTTAIKSNPSMRGPKIEMRRDSLNKTHSSCKVIPEPSKLDSARFTPQKIFFKDISDNPRGSTQNSAMFNSQKSACDNNAGNSKSQKRCLEAETVDTTSSPSFIRPRRVSLNGTNSSGKVIHVPSKLDSVKINSQRISFSTSSDNSGLQTQDSAILNSQKVACDKNPANLKPRRRDSKTETVDTSSGKSNSSVTGTKVEARRISLNTTNSSGKVISEPSNLDSVRFKPQTVTFKDISDNPGLPVKHSSSWNSQKSVCDNNPAISKSGKQGPKLETIDTSASKSSPSVTGQKIETRRVSLNATNGSRKVVTEPLKLDSVRLNSQKTSFKDISDNAKLQTQNSAILNSQKSACDNRTANSKSHKQGPKPETVDTTFSLSVAEPEKENRKASLNATNSSCKVIPEPSKLRSARGNPQKIFFKDISDNPRLPTKDSVSLNSQKSVSDNHSANTKASKQGSKLETVDTASGKSSPSMTGPKKETRRVSFNSTNSSCKVIPEPSKLESVSFKPQQISERQQQKDISKNPGLQTQNSAILNSQKSVCNNNPTNSKSGRRDSKADIVDSTRSKSITSLAEPKIEKRRVSLNGTTNSCKIISESSKLDSVRSNPQKISFKDISDNPGPQTQNSTSLNFQKSASDDVAGNLKSHKQESLGVAPAKRPRTSQSPVAEPKKKSAKMSLNRIFNTKKSKCKDATVNSDPPSKGSVKETAEKNLRKMVSSKPVVTERMKELRKMAVDKRFASKHYWATDLQKTPTKDICINSELLNKDSETSSNQDILSQPPQPAQSPRQPKPQQLLQPPQQEIMAADVEESILEDFLGKRTPTRPLKISRKMSLNEMTPKKKSRKYTVHNTVIKKKVRSVSKTLLESCQKKSFEGACQENTQRQKENPSIPVLENPGNAQEIKSDECLIKSINVICSNKEVESVSHVLPFESLMTDSLDQWLMSLCEPADESASLNENCFTNILPVLDKTENLEKASNPSKKCTKTPENSTNLLEKSVKPLENSRTISLDERTHFEAVTPFKSVSPSVAYSTVISEKTQKNLLGQSSTKRKNYEPCCLDNDCCTCISCMKTPTKTPKNSPVILEKPPEMQLFENLCDFVTAEDFVNSLSIEVPAVPATTEPLEKREIPCGKSLVNSSSLNKVENPFNRLSSMQQLEDSEYLRSTFRHLQEIRNFRLLVECQDELIEVEKEFELDFSTCYNQFITKYNVLPQY